VNLLLDTHVAIWSLVRPQRIPTDVALFIADPNNLIFVSAVSIWEIAIKYRLGKVDAPPFSGTDAIGYFREAGYLTLEMTAAHGAYVETLPLLHGDPFDRLLVAQALSEPMRLVSRDPKVAAYSDTVITW
jgi:PIN domain nuclease of toxin-antitoxin system